MKPLNDDRFHEGGICVITIPIFQIKEASRIYGDFAEMDKVAFDLNIDPASVLGSIAGGYTANSVYTKKKDKYEEKELAKRRIENNTYSQVQNILRDLKIVFTPINVVYSVNGQVFEIIKSEEMTPHMKRAFLQKDANYFRDLLVNKINMEIQLAERAFSQRLLAAGGYNQQAKQANYLSKQEAFIKLAEDDFDSMVKTASVGIENHKLKIDPSFSSLRPFSQSEIFFKEKEFQKVAGIFDMFKTDQSEDVSLNRLNGEVNVGFLPDRVVYLWNGQLIEQMSLLHMNEEGYEAFQKKDKQFFIDYFREHTKKVSKSLKRERKSDIQDDFSEPSLEPESVQSAFDQEDEINKQADAFEDIVEELVEEEFPVVERDKIDIFKDPDIHPLVYDRVLSDHYGSGWVEYEMESLLKQLEIDFELTEGISDNPLNKISVLHAVSGENHAMYQSPLTFEKFMRAINSKDVIFEEFQGNLSFEEILFGLEVAKAIDGDEVFLEFHENIAPYLSEELMKENIRYVSDQLYDEENPSEKDFFKSINGFLMRKWKEIDAQGIYEEEEIENRYTQSLQIVEIAEDVLSKHAEDIEINDPYSSVKSIIVTEGMTDSVDASDREGIKNMAAETAVAHFLAGVFIEYKFNELAYTVEKLKEGGVIRGE